MKKLIVCCLAVIMTVSVRAQISDTLGFAEYNSGTETLYESPNGGYAFGNNGYGDLAKAQQFSHDQSFVIREVLLKFGAVEFNSADSTSSVLVNIYNFGGSGVSIVSTSDSIAPDSIISSRQIPIHELTDDGTLSVVDFSSETIVIQPNERFFVAIEFDSLALGDTLGLFSTSDEDPSESYLSWELTSNGVWVIVGHPAYSWNLDVDLGIFVAVDVNDPAGVAELNNQSQLTLYPNPATDFVRVDLKQTINGPVSYRLISPQGRLVDSNTVFKDSFSINTESFATGVYVLLVETEDSVISERVVISK